MKKRLYKYYPEDFGSLKVKVLHMDLDFDVYDDHTKVVSDLKLKTLEKISSLELNANNLEIHEISADVGEIKYEYKEKEDKIIITFSKAVPAKKEITITTKTTCKPTKNVLEGIYYDETPEGAPPTQITQCQQWGFQRIVPCIDDMTAKCTYKTTITADSKYTNIITNGDLISKKNFGKRTRVIYHNITTPMSTYLFFLGVGTYATFKREVEYSDGKKFMLELLVPPNSKKEIANHALDVIHDSVIWVRLFTGPDKYKNYDTSLKIWELIKKREELKKSKKDFSSVNRKIKDLAKPLHLGYQYTGTVYREIGMQNSDFGGMENVGNTTITTNRIMPFPDMSDGGFEYMIDVKVHEYYHNLNGSEVTGRSPFEIWLNEAVTVHIEREFFAFLFGEDYSRFGEVLTLLAPGGGTLAMDSGVASMPIEPDGFNDCNELITSVTYVKAPEFVRMIQSLTGKENFVKGLDLYHSKFKHGNASREDWISAMEKASGLDFKEMAQQWLKKTGFPIVKVEKNYQKNNLILTLIQENIKKEKDCWKFPFSVALFNKNGKVIAEKTEHIKHKIQEIYFNDVKEPAFISLNRNYSFFGKVKQNISREELFLQVRKDDNLINRYMAFYQLWDQEKTKLLKNENEEVNEDLLELYFEFLNDEKLMEKVSTQILTIFESVEDEKFAHHYDKLHKVRKKISKTIATKHEKEILTIYKKYAGKKSTGTYLEQQMQNIKWRQVKNLCLAILSNLDTPKVHKLIKKQFLNAKSATDRMTALRLYLNSSAADCITLLEDYQEKAKENLVRWEAFLYVVGSNDNKKYLDLIKKVEKSPSFRINQSNDQRGLFVTMAMNKKKSLLTPEGRNYLKQKIVQLAKINEYTTGRMIKIFGNVDKVEEKFQVPLIELMVDILKKLDEHKTPSVYNTLKRILLKLPKATSKYEKEKGKIEFLN